MTPEHAACTSLQQPITSAPALGPERPVAWPKRTVRTLANGLEVVLAESRTFPKITAQLYFRSGNAVVAHSAPGLADITATVVRTGTASRPSRHIEEDLAPHGSGCWARTPVRIHSAISVSGLAEFSAGLLELMADLARNASFPEDEFERERRQKIEELTHRAHHSRFSRQRTSAPHPFRRASVRRRRAYRRASSRLRARRTPANSTAITIRRRMRC